MGRPGYACRDKWRMMRDNPKTGEWGEDEVARLKVVQPFFLCIVYLLHFLSLKTRAENTCATPEFSTKYHMSLTEYSVKFLFSILLSQELVQEYFDEQQAGPGRGGARLSFLCFFLSSCLFSLVLSFSCRHLSSWHELIFTSFNLLQPGREKNICHCSTTSTGSPSHRSWALAMKTWWGC